MNQSSSNEKVASMTAIETINAVEGFDPTPFAVDFTDLNTQEVRKRLPVMIQMAWFRLKYPEGRIAVSVAPSKDCFVATARVYPNYKDGADAYLSEATASRGYLTDKPTVSPREWAQTAAIGIALRNAGFGLQFAMAGEDFETIATNEFGESRSNQGSPQDNSPDASGEPETVSVTPIELTPEQKLDLALKQPCPISKYNGKTLGDLITQDPNALVWLATKYKGSEEISAAAKLICDSASQTSL